MKSDKNTAQPKPAKKYKLIIYTPVGAAPGSQKSHADIVREAIAPEAPSVPADHWDDKLGIIFSEKATFGELNGDQYEEGLGVILPNIAKSGVRKMSVSACTELTAPTNSGKSPVIVW